MTPEGWAAVVSIVGFLALAARQVFFTEFKIKNIISKDVEGSLPNLSAQIKKIQEEKLTAAEKALEAIKEERGLPITSTPLGQKVHDMANSMTAHYAHDDQRFDALKGSMEAMRVDQAANTQLILNALSGRAPRKR